MPVHLVHARDQGAALTINDCFISGSRAVCRLNAGDAIAVHHHVPDCAEGQGFGLKNPDVGNADRSVVLVGDPGLYADEAISRQCLCQSTQLFFYRLVTGPH